jgi:hypothetical protein
MARRQFTAKRSGSGRRPGRPRTHTETWTKTTVVLFDRQIDFLDTMAAKIRAKSGAPISRAQLIRALLDAFADSDIDLTLARSETDLKAAILARLWAPAGGLTHVKAARSTLTD